MNRSVLSHTSFAAQIALAAAMLVLVVLFAVFALQSKMPANFVPVTGPQSMPAAVQKMDLGAGYTLVTNAQGTHIIAPEAINKSASQTLDLGAGYILRDGQIVAPASTVKAQPVTSQTLDLGAGYILRDGQIVAPASTVKPQPVTSQKFDIGGGYWLVLTGDSGEIVH